LVPKQAVSVPPICQKALELQQFNVGKGAVQGQQIDAFRSRFTQYRTSNSSTDPVRTVLGRVLPEVEGIMSDIARAGAGDPHDLNRFVEAQEGVYEQALAEVRGGRKRSHWMWFIFPQIDGLGSSAMAKRYAIKSRAEAEAYLAHPVLGPRLVACAEAAAGIPATASALDVFGSPDDMKLRSSATLFACVSPAGSVFDRVLDRYFRGERDSATLRLLGTASAPA
jgi:uncharacterized protein (DUF1810 family)